MSKEKSPISFSIAGIASVTINEHNIIVSNNACDKSLILSVVETALCGKPKSHIDFLSSSGLKVNQELSSAFSLFAINSIVDKGLLCPPHSPRNIISEDLLKEDTCCGELIESLDEETISQAAKSIRQEVDTAQLIAIYRLH